ncbi:MAG TPA: AAA family ATPase [Candidatus Saccharimonadales bacterium]|nr:AAA family ATPase [Candidatus Saccharimonadales bacterium]
MQRLIIIRGNSGSGKSTVAKKLQHKMGYETMLIPQDVVRREMLRVRDKPDNPSIQLVYELAMYGKKIGFDVIVEGIFVNERYGDTLRKLINDFGGQSHVYYFDISLEETLKRHNSKPNAHEFGEKELREWWIEKDYLNVPNEKHILASMNEDEITEMFVGNMGINTKFHENYVR